MDLYHFSYLKHYMHSLLDLLTQLDHSNLRSHLEVTNHEHSIELFSYIFHHDYKGMNLPLAIDSYFKAFTRFWEASSACPDSSMRPITPFKYTPIIEAKASLSNFEIED